MAHAEPFKVGGARIEPPKFEDAATDGGGAGFLACRCSGSVDCTFAFPEVAIEARPVVLAAPPTVDGAPVVEEESEDPPPRAEAVLPYALLLATPRNTPPKLLPLPPLIWTPPPPLEEPGKELVRVLPFSERLPMLVPAKTEALSLL